MKRNAAEYQNLCAKVITSTRQYNTAEELP